MAAVSAGISRPAAFPLTTSYAFPDGQSALNLAAARLRHIAGTMWSAKRCMNMQLLKQKEMIA